jgi:hypothetical protein
MTQKNQDFTKCHMLGVPVVSRMFSLQADSEIHAASYLMGNGDSFPGLKRPAHEANHSASTSTDNKKMLGLYIQSPISPHGLVLS